MHVFSRLCAGLSPAPAWLVSNGEVTVGPVETDLLVRGVLSGKIPADCRVSMDGAQWRPVEQVREVRRARAPLDGADALLPGSIRHAIEWLSDARAVQEAFSLALFGACLLTGAQVGILHRRRSPFEAPVVAASSGPVACGVGTPLPRHDQALSAAESGEPTLLRPEGSDAARVMAARLSPGRTLAGLALVPIRAPLDVVGVIELGRFDHPFRTHDARSLVPLVAATLARVEELSWQRA